MSRKIITDDYRKGREVIANEYSNRCSLHKLNDKSLGNYDYGKAVFKFERCSISRESTVLDIGCGTGNLLRYLKSKCDYDETNYTGIDFSETMIDFCSTQYPNADFLHGDILETDKSNSFYLKLNRTYDFVICLSTIQQKVVGIQNDLYTKHTVSRCLNLTKTDGYTIFDVFSEKFVDYRDEFSNYLDPIEVLNFCFSLSDGIKMDTTFSPYEVLFHIQKK